jgi:hypothetical protein
MKKDLYINTERIMKELFDSENGSIEEKIAMDKFEANSFDIFYNSLIRGFIYEKEDIYDTFIYYVNSENNERIEKIISILNKYYKGYIEEKFNELIELEEYEKCSKLKKYL